MSQLKTKKFIVALRKDGRASSSSGFVIPSPDGSPCFIDIKNGKMHDFANIVYIGVEITESDVFEQMNDSIREMQSTKKSVNSLFEQISNFKIGNVLKVLPGNFVLEKHANRPKSDESPRIPGERHNQRPTRTPQRPGLRGLDR